MTPSLIKVKMRLDNTGYTCLVRLDLGHIPSRVTFDVGGVESTLLLVIPGNRSGQIVSLPLSSGNSSLHHEAG